jgi:hypothetical protein
MNTNAQPDDFEQLRKLLALKRHEVPPPGYFNRFSDNVIARLRAPEPMTRPTWLQLLGLDFDLKPAFLCATGVAVCALLSLGIIVATQVDPNSGQFTSQNIAQNPVEIAVLNPAIMAFGPGGSVQKPEEVQPSTAPSTLFSHTPSLRAQNVSFNFGSR